MQLPELLRQRSLFIGMKEEDVERIAQIAQLRSFQEGETICHEGDEGKAIYVLLEGEVAVMATGCDEPLAHLKVGGSFVEGYSGDFFGEMSILDMEPMSASLVATSNGKIAIFPAERLRQLINARPECLIVLLSNMLLTMSRRLRQTTMSALRWKAQARGS